MFHFDSDEDNSQEDSVSEDDENVVRSSSKFIPPHEMVAKDKSFEVGTARSLAVWESQRRRKMSDFVAE